VYEKPAFSYPSEESLSGILNFTLEGRYQVRAHILQKDFSSASIQIRQVKKGTGHPRVKRGCPESYSIVVCCLNAAVD